MGLEVYGPVWAACAFACYAIARRRRAPNAITWLVVGAVLGPLGVLLVALEPLGRTAGLGVAALLVAEAWILFLAMGLVYPTNATIGHEAAQGQSAGLLLIGDCLILMPVGWLACLSGTATGRRISLACATGIAIVAAVASSIAASVRPDDQPAGAVVLFVLLAIPAGLLLWGIRSMARRSPKV